MTFLQPAYRCLSSPRYISIPMTLLVGAVSGLVWGSVKSMLGWNKDVCDTRDGLLNNCHALVLPHEIQELGTAFSGTMLAHMSLVKRPKPSSESTGRITSVTPPGNSGVQQHALYSAQRSARGVFAEPFVSKLS